MPPLTTNLGPADRYGLSGPLSAPLTTGSRSGNTFPPPHGFDIMSAFDRQNRNLHSLHGRDSVPRIGSEASPLGQRPEMPWRTSSVDYTHFHHQSSDAAQRARQPSLQHHDSDHSSSVGGLAAIGSVHRHAVASSDDNGLPQVFQNRPRLRAASASLPINFDFRSQYRHNPNLHTPEQVGAYSMPSYGGQYQSPPLYTTSFPSAPLAAPSEYSQSASARPSGDDKPRSQMSAPLVPPSDFSAALKGVHGEEDSRGSAHEALGLQHLGYQQGQRATPGSLHSGRGVLSPRGHGYPTPLRQAEHAELPHVRGFNRPA
jgi:hypothetical protein